jgi:tetratricopeptide (TPR) repeat protein
VKIQQNLSSHLFICLTLCGFAMPLPEVRAQGVNSSGADRNGHSEQEGKLTGEEHGVQTGNGADKKVSTQEASKHFYRAVELHQSGFFNQAIAEYKAAIELDSKMEEAFSNLGVIYVGQRNYPKAKEAFQTALSLKPGRPTSLNGLGAVLYAQGHTQEAKDMWLKALSVDGNFASAYYNLGNAYESEKNGSEALSSYTKAIAAAPTMAEAYFRIGTIFNNESHYAQASTLLRKAIALDPEGYFVREAKHIQNNLEEKFAKGDRSSRSGDNIDKGLGSHGASAETIERTISGGHEKNGSPSTVDMFIQPKDEQIKKSSSE